MLKMFGRTLIVLIAAALISLGWYTYATTAADSTILQDEHGQVSPEGEGLEDRVAGEDGQRLPPPEGESSSTLVRLLTGMASVAGKVALAVVVVSSIRVLIKRVKPMFSKKGQRPRLGPAPSRPG